MQVHLRCYGALNPIFGGDRVAWQFSGASVQELLADLAQRQPGFASWQNRVACALGDHIVHGDYALTAGDEIALLPPVGGG